MKCRGCARSGRGRPTRPARAPIFVTVGLIAWQLSACAHAGGGGSTDGSADRADQVDRLSAELSPIDRGGGEIDPPHDITRPPVDMSPTDAVPAGPCAHDTPFGDPVEVIVPVDLAVETAFLAYDETTILLGARAAGGTSRIHVASFLVPSALDTVVELPGLAPDPLHDDSKPTLTADGTTLYFCSSRSGEDTLWRSQRQSGSGIDATFGAPARVSELDAMGRIECDPSISADGQTLLFAATSSGLNYEIERAALAATGQFGADRPVNAVNDPNAIDGFPYASVDGLAVYFSRAPFDLSQRHIYVSIRPAPGSGLGAPMPLALGPADSIESSPSLSADACRLYFTSGGKLYVAERAAR